MSATLVSVIIPTYNSAKSILKCINSVLNQTYRNFEIIVCDDCSVDNTVTILNNIQDGRVKTIYLDKNSGSAVARNTAMLKSEGQLIAFLDSDDEWYPEKLSMQVECFSDLQTGIVLTGADIIKNHRKTTTYLPDKTWEIDSYRKLFLGILNYKTPTVAFRRECLDKVGLMAPELRRNQDFDFFLRVLKYYTLKVVPIPLTRINIDTKKRACVQLENSINFYKKNRTMLFQQDFTEHEINLFFARKYRDAACIMIRAHNYKSALVTLRRSLEHSRTFIFNPKNIILLLKSLIG